MRRLLMAVLALQVITLKAEPIEPVRVAMMPFAGYAVLDDQGVPQGSGVDTVSQLLDEAGYPFEIRVLPPARVLAGLTDGSVELWPGMLNKPYLQEHVILTRHDLGLIEIALFRRPGTPPVEWPHGLRGKELISITNYTYTEPLLDALRMVDDLRHHHSSSHVGALEMLLRGRGDYLLQYVAQVGPLLQEQGLPMLPMQLLSGERMRLLISRHSPRAESLRDDLDAAWLRLQARGQLLDLRYRWEAFPAE